MWLYNMKDPISTVQDCFENKPALMGLAGAVGCQSSPYTNI